MTATLTQSLLLPDSGASALTVSSPLTEYNEAGVLDSADIRIALSLLEPGSSPIVVWGVALTIRALRHGSVCYDLTFDPQQLVPSDDPDAATVTLPAISTKDLRAAMKQHPQVSCEDSTSAPLRLRGDLLYLEKYLEQEQVVAETMLANRAQPAWGNADEVREALAQIFGAPGPDRQRLAAAAALTNRITILAGGPGTGKTTTVASIVALLRMLQPEGRMLFGAPTGKAAARLTEATNEKLAEFADLPEHLSEPISATTLHRMLGSLPGKKTRFRHNRSNPLPADTVVVDEASMISLTHMTRLLEALRPSTRLLLVGDPEQLASVDAGAVLADLTRGTAPAATVPQLRELVPADEPESVTGCGVVTLDRNYRASSGIADLAQAIKAGAGEDTLRILDRAPEIEYVSRLGSPEQAPAQLRGLVTSIARRTAAAAESGDAEAALLALEEHRLLCAHRRGPQGVSAWSKTIRGWLHAPEDEHYFPGQPLLVTHNDYQHQLFNGDVGVVIRSNTGVRAVFRRQDGYVQLQPAQLEGAETPYAMTIHRGQGSEFDEVTVVLPEPKSRLLTRELFYTAVTRARMRLRVIGPPAAVRHAVRTRVQRASGLSL